MKLKILSDLHLEFGPIDPGVGDVLILAGDICTVEDLATNCGNAVAYREFFQSCSDGYKKVFYVMGNHEYYHYRMDWAADVLRDHLPNNFTLLNNSSEYYNGVHFVGATMWADFNNNDMEMRDIAQSCMNDYRTVMLNGDTQLSTTDTLIEHDNTVEWFGQVLPMLKQGKKVVITHHAPSFESLDPGYNHELRGAYASDLTPLIRREKPDLWIHGHIHASNDYQVGETRIVSNPRGYYPSHLNKGLST